LTLISRVRPLSPRAIRTGPLEPQLRRVAKARRCWRPWGLRKQPPTPTKRCPATKPLFKGLELQWRLAQNENMWEMEQRMQRFNLQDWGSLQRQRTWRWARRVITKHPLEWSQLAHAAQNENSWDDLGESDVQKPTI